MTTLRAYTFLQCVVKLNVVVETPSTFCFFVVVYLSGHFLTCSSERFIVFLQDAVYVYKVKTISIFRVYSSKLLERKAKKKLTCSNVQKLSMKLLFSYLFPWVSQLHFKQKWFIVDWLSNVTMIRVNLRKNLSIGLGNIRLIELWEKPLFF